MRNLKKFNKALSSFFDGQVKWAAGLLENPTGKPKRVKRVRKVEPMEWDEGSAVKAEEPKADIETIESEPDISNAPEAKEPEAEESDKLRSPTALPPKRERSDKLKPVVLTSRGQQKEKERFKTKAESSDSAPPKAEEFPVEKPKPSERAAEQTKAPEVTMPEEDAVEDKKDEPKKRSASSSPPSIKRPGSSHPAR